MADTFEKIFRSFGSAHPPHQLFSDFCTMAATSISNSARDFQAIADVERREKEFTTISAKYSEAENEAMSKLLGLTAIAIEETPEQDFLGSMYQALEISNKGAGQFFTPYHVGAGIAKTTLSDIGEMLHGKRYISIQDPCVGGGALLIAAFNEAKALGFNPQTQCLFYGADTDPTCIRMAYIQCSLLGMCGHFIHGNSLAVEQWDSFTTPMFYLNAWRFIRKKDASEQTPRHLVPDATPEHEKLPTRNPQPQQLSLF